MSIEIAELIERWNTDEGRPYKGSLIDLKAYKADTENIGCMCAQGQVLHLIGGIEPQGLKLFKQARADAEAARLLNISRAHSVLLRDINDSASGAPAIVLTSPWDVLGGQWSKLLDFWWMFDQYSEQDWLNVSAA